MVKKHGNKQIDYSRFFEISKDNTREDYKIDIWFFIPTNLNNGSYKSEDFFNDFTTYTRYNAPNISLNCLTDSKNPKNPLTRLQNLGNETDKYQEIEYELKTLLNTFKVSTEKVITSIIAKKNFNDLEVLKNINFEIERFNIVLNRLKQISKNSPAQLNFIYNLAIEGISLRIEKTLYKIYRINQVFEAPTLKEIKYQRAFREKIGFKSITSTDEKNNSKAIYKEHMIKKWSESMMYINMESSKTQSGLNHLFLGTAAALAMLITGIFAILASRVWGNDSLYLFIAAMILYSLKDRFKDIFKPIFLRRMTRIYADRIKTIVSPINKRKCGKSMESVSFPKHDDLKKEVQELRFYLKDEFSIKQHQEDIIHYKKQVKVVTSKLYKNHTRLFGIKEIMRYDFRKWFNKMDKDVEKCYIPGVNKLDQVNGDREYHFNIIVQIKSSKQKTLKRYRVVANSRKIKKIYSVS